ncbi:endonuclease MutS2 [Lactobacillus sp.] [Lactiplantibacillus mudanjiangensis]|uniref:endonuclease MutS2 n=1 Tax=Lactiplantibacillus mudanjiangensis TaxID=1296538 RepID=UPI00101535AC|nr:endonuclease MutS2 [Lactiplantibacillus mudanjiangensis]VDG33294.1 endonuclease MutS2 [Lactobacillus sp.] [Lactiplantibacillus mudanjiangensis]
MNPKVLATLEYQQVKQQLAPYLVSAAGQKELSALQPMTTLAEVQYALDETNDGVEVYRLKGGIPVARLADITPHMKRLAIGATLNGSELGQVGRVLKTTRAITRFFEELLADAPENDIRHLFDEVQTLVTLPEVTKRLATAIEGDGHITDNASPELASIRSHISKTEGEIRSRMERYTHGKEAKYLSDPIITIRNDRYVIPVKAENRGRFGGIVHDQSASGQTLFIEPQAVMALNDRLRQNQVAEKQEEQRILEELSNLIAPYQDEILENAAILGHFDFINAKARYARAMHANEPAVSTTNEVLLRQARHPLIDQKKVVANDIALGTDYQAIVITGPNTGGKTITLKTLGLLQLMGQSGLFIPVDMGSRIAIYHEIFADIGDEQSIEQNLSTFSSHMENIESFLKQIDDHSLVLVDELGAGTDPQEGAALAIAILDAIGGHGTQVVATTHYPELKAYGFNRPETINASMEFDEATLKPTYRLLVGIPGRSNALDIAQRLGIPQAIVDQARSLTDTDSQDLNAMIADLVTKRKQVEDAQIQLKAEVEDSEKLHKQLKSEFNAYQQQKDQLMEEAKVEANAIVEKSKTQADAIISDLRKKQLATGANIKENELIDAKGALNALEQQPKLKKNRVLRRAKAKQDFHKGDDVLVKSYGQRGVLVQKMGNHAWEVQLGILKMKINEADMERTQAEAEPKRARATVQSANASHVSPNLDLRGVRYEDAMMQVDRYIDAALLAGYPSVTIVHGKGTGALRQGITEYLQGNRQVKSFHFAAPNHGGNGATEVQFK